MSYQQEIIYCEANSYDGHVDFNKVNEKLADGWKVNKIVAQYVAEGSGSIRHGGFAVHIYK